MLVLEIHNSVSQNDHSATTDDNGNFRFSNLPIQSLPHDGIGAGKTIPPSTLTSTEACSTAFRWKANRRR